MKVQDMTHRYRKFKRAWGMWYAFDNATGNSVSLKTRVKIEAEQKVQAMNETERQPSISLGLARVYLNATDPKLATRTWQEVMENIVSKKTGETALGGGHGCSLAPYLIIGPEGIPIEVAAGHV
jgi:hypothetical protein